LAWLRWHRHQGASHRQASERQRRPVGDVQLPEVGNRITLTNFLSAETAEARVLATPHSREGVSHGIVVELIISSESFWGVNLQVKKASVELQKLEDSLRRRASICAF